MRSSPYWILSKKVCEYQTQVSFAATRACSIGIFFVNLLLNSHFWWLDHHLNVCRWPHRIDQKRIDHKRGETSNPNLGRVTPKVYGEPRGVGLKSKLVKRYFRYDKRHKAPRVLYFDVTHRNFITYEN